MNINFGVETECIKLSLQGDKHLLKEAKSVFQHWRSKAHADN